MNNPKCLVVIDLRQMSQLDSLNIYQLFRQNLKAPPTSMEIERVLDNLYSNLSRTFVVNVKDQKLNYSMFDCIHSSDYNQSLQTCVDSFIYELSLIGLLIELETAHKFVQNSELSMINEICSFIPNIDESTMSIVSTNYKPGFNFFMIIDFQAIGV